MNNEVTKTEGSRPAALKQRWLLPAADICDDEGKVLLRLEMPGVDKQHLDIQVEGSQLRIRGDRQPAEPAAGGSKGKYLLRERQEGSYLKTYTLDETIDTNKIQAKMEDGVLLLELSIKEAVKPRRIEIG
ncbi:MAG: Hsp20/alpha crystallin family protein [Spirochaetes bacterium]|nr:Hsp20/alpha crystallin family protein [Spirochaetota bacterium]MBU0956315.1 Hsp20/alpha crystallin family protein [Spirochaetota bacterium]